MAKVSAYRADIDGLRAISVMAVVLFHAFPRLITGGFVGVDVFFVVSGYLITDIILNKLNHNEFKISDFYSRRIRRIFPSLFIVISFFLVLGWFALLGNEFMSLGKHAAGGSAFISNFISWGEGGYFDIKFGEKPLIHLWSLGIEEQFYIIWPIFMVITWKSSWRIPLLIIAFVGSFSSNIWLTYSNSNSAFYFPAHHRMLQVG